MKLPFINQRATIFVLMLSLIAWCWFGANVGVHAQAKLPAASGHVNDFAEVLDAATRDRLEKILDNLKQRTGIDFVIATVKSTGSEKLYDYSLRIARDWDVGVMTSPKKSVLLTISSDNGEFLAHISRGARADLPDGLIGDMGQRIQEKIKSAGYSEGLLTGVKTFANGVGERNNFTFADLDQHPAENLIAEQQRPRTVNSPAAQPTETPLAQPTETPATQPTELCRLSHRNRLLLQRAQGRRKLNLRKHQQSQPRRSSFRPRHRQAHRRRQPRALRLSSRRRRHRLRALPRRLHQAPQTAQRKNVQTIQPRRLDQRIERQPLIRRLVPTTKKRPLKLRWPCRLTKESTP